MCVSTWKLDFTHLFTLKLLGCKGTGWGCRKVGQFGQSVFLKNVFFRGVVDTLFFAAFDIINDSFAENLEDMKIFFFNINYFHQVFGLFDISMMQKKLMTSDITDVISIFVLSSTYFK